MTSLKIAVVVGQFPTVSETFITNQIGFLKQSGHDVDILCLGKKNDNTLQNTTVSKYQLLEHTQVFSWRHLMPLNKIMRLFLLFSILFKSLGSRVFFKLFKSLNPIKYKTNAFNFNQFFRTYYTYFFELNAYDVVHVHFGDNAVRIEKLLKRHTKKIVVTFHGYDAHYFEAPFYKNLQSLTNIQFTVNTHFLKDKLIHLGFPESKIKILHAGFDMTYFKPDSKPHDTFNLLFVGRLIELKAPLLAIKITECVVKRGYTNVHLSIVGDGEDYDKCLAYVNLKNLHHAISMHGSANQDEIKEIMSKTDVFLFPGIIDKQGRCETQGLVAQEAQAMAIPVLVSDVGGTKEGMVHNQTGYVVKSQDIEAFADAVIKLINHPEKCKEMGEAGRRFVLSKYDIAILGEQLLTMYQS